MVIELFDRGDYDAYLKLFVNDFRICTKGKQ